MIPSQELNTLAEQLGASDADKEIEYIARGVLNLVLKYRWSAEETQDVVVTIAGIIDAVLRDRAESFVLVCKASVDEVLDKKGEEG